MLSQAFDADLGGRDIDQVRPRVLLLWGPFPLLSDLAGQGLHVQYVTPICVEQMFERHRRRLHGAPCSFVIV